MTSSVFLMILATIFFVIAHSTIKLLSPFPLHEIIFFRLAHSLLLCLLYFAYIKKNPFIHLSWPLFLRGLFGATAMVLFFYTLSAMPLATAITINYLAPLFSMILALFLMGERPKPMSWVFLGFAFIGVLVVKGFSSEISWLDFTIALTAAMLAGAAYAFVRKASLKSGPMLVVFVLPLVGIFPSTLSLLSFDFVWPTLSQFWILVVMATCVFIAQVCMTLSYLNSEVARVTLPRYLTIVWSLLIGYFFFNEKLAETSLLGIGIIVCALIGNEIYNKKN